MDKKNIAIVAALVVVLLFYFQIMEFLGFYKPAPSQPAVQDTVTDTTTQIAQSQPVTPPAPDTTTGVPAAVVAKVEAFVAGPESIDTIVVTTEKYIVTLTSFGGGPVSMLLRDYDYRNDTLIEMIPDGKLATPEAKFAGGQFSTSSINFSSDVAPGNYTVGREPLDIVYSYQPASGGEIKRHFRFYPDNYHYDLYLEVNGLDLLGFDRMYNLVWNTPLGVTEPQAETDYQAMEAVAMQAGSRVTLDDYNDGQLQQSMTGSTSWAGLRSKYFAAVMIPTNRLAESVSASGRKQDISTADGKVEMKEITVGMEMPFTSISPNFADSFKVFVGPLSYTLLSSYDIGLEDMLGIGTTPYVGWIIKPFAIAIIWLLPRMYSVIPNYGLVIILFALLVKLVTMPLSMKSFKSMNAMKELQPKMEELKKKHKNNPQALNQEMMKLYKTHGVNPMSGCLPMLPQMPLFFALFSVFRATILLRDAPFVWFITDLSRGATSFLDPYIVLVIIMIAAQFVSQKLTMATSQQNKMFMYIMPLFMGFIFYRFAAGLVLYWACFSIFSLIDYFAFKRTNKNAEVKTA